MKIVSMDITEELYKIVRTSAKQMSSALPSISLVGFIAKYYRAVVAVQSKGQAIMAIPSAHGVFQAGPFVSKQLSTVVVTIVNLNF